MQRELLTSSNSSSLHALKGQIFLQHWFVNSSSNWYLGWGNYDVIMEGLRKENVLLCHIKSIPWFSGLYCNMQYLEKVEYVVCLSQKAHLSLLQLISTSELHFRWRWSHVHVYGHIHCCVLFLSICILQGNCGSFALFNDLIIFIRLSVFSFYISVHSKYSVASGNGKNSKVLHTLFPLNSQYAMAVQVSFYLDVMPYLYTHQTNTVVFRASHATVVYYIFVLN